MARKNDSRSRERQGELFDEFQEQSPGHKGRPLARDIVFGRKISFQLSYENIILLFIVFIMLLVIFFALGVEKGKRIGRSSVKQDKTQATAVEPTTDMSIPKKTVERVKAVTPDEGKPYTIQVVSFKKENSARKEAGLLQAEGYHPSIIPSSGWFQVCVGAYANREEAKDDLKALEDEYPTRFFRERSVSILDEGKR